MTKITKTTIIDRRNWTVKEEVHTFATLKEAREWYEKDKRKPENLDCNIFYDFD